MFFNKSKKKNQKKEGKKKENVEEKVEKDLIVHNMPKEGSLKGDSTNPVAAGKVSVSNIESSDKKSKLVGVLIMIGGLILISGLVFLTYRYAISPVAKDDNQQNNTTNNQEQNEVVDNEKEKNNQEEDKKEENKEEVILEEEVEIEIPEKEEISTTTEEVEEELIILDSDNDGLSDKEEIVLGTNLNKIDSDGDSYSDLQELENLYDPISTGRLEDNENLKLYINNNYNLSFIYPKDFSVKNNEDNLFILETLNSSFFQFTVTENIDNQGIYSWYETTFSQSNINPDKVVDKENYEGVIGSNGLNFYFTDNNQEYIYVLSYTPSKNEGLAFENIFNMMINSIKVLDKEE